jgi:phage terminase large subunit-like protein
MAARSEGPFVAEFLAKFCRHPRGPLAGTPVQIVPEQAQVLNEILELNEEGLWAKREALIMVHRKWAKTLISSGVGLSTLLTKNMGTEIYFAANSRAQATILKRNVDAFALSSDVLRKRLYVYKNKIETPYGSHIGVLGADAHQAHGYNPMLSVIDEYWAFKDATLPEALSSGAAARPESMTLYITTPGISMASPLGQLVERYRRGDDSLYVHWPGESVGPDVDVEDREAWREYNLGFRYGWVAESFLQSQARALSKSEFVRLHLGGWLKQSSGWMNMYAWDEQAKPGRALERGERVVLFVDGAWKHDSVAVVACTTGPDPHLRCVKVWEKPPNDELWRVPYHEIDATIRTLIDEYHVAQIGADPFFLGQLLQSWYDEGMPVLEIPTNSVTRSVPATKRFMDALMEKRLTHDGNPVLRRHIQNSVPKQDARGLRIMRDYGNPSGYIDAAVAAIFAHDMASKIGAEARVWLY